MRFSEYGGYLEELLKAMEDAGASRAVVVNLFFESRARSRAVAQLPENLDEDQKQEELRAIDAGLGEELKAKNRWVCGVAAKYPQLVPFINTDPRLLRVDEAEAHIRDMVDHQGAKGIKLHPPVQGFHMHDERMRPIFQLCVELGLPVIAHSGPSKGVDQHAEPRAFAETLKAFPELRLVLAHMGGAAWRQMTKIAQKFPNVYFDCSEIIEWTGSPNGPTDRQLAQLILKVGSERVMMGSDFPVYDIDHNVARVMALPLLSASQKEAILGANAMRILSL